MVGDANDDATEESLPLDPDATEATFAFVGPGVRFLLGGSGPARAVFGTSLASDAVLPGRQASRRHAAVEIQGASVVVIDLGSKNGTWVNGVRVREAELRGGEQIVLGESTFVVERGPVAPVALAKDARFGMLVGASHAMRRLYPLLVRLAATTVPALIQGEAGTGKEALAESLHAEGPRAEGAFVVLDCADTPPATFEDLLSAALDRANGGTLLLDEIAELPAPVQAKLLRAVERGATTGVRLLVTTRRDLDREIAAGRFREDLYLRVAVARVELPPLRKRASDIPLLAAHFAAELGGDAGTLPLETWRDRPWPGNIRELQNQVARHIALGDVAALGIAEHTKTPDPAATDWLVEILAENLLLVDARNRVNAVFERRYVEHMLAEHGGNVVRAAARAGVARRYFQILKAKRLP